MNDPRLKLEMQDGAIVISLPGTDYQSPLAVYFLFVARATNKVEAENWGLCELSQHWPALWRIALESSIWPRTRADT